MKRLLPMGVAIMVLASSITPVWADDVAELKVMIQQMKADYESRIDMLESKIDQLEAKQDQKVASLTKEIKETRMLADYEPGHGVTVHGPGESSFHVHGYFDHEFENFENSNATFDQYHLNLGVAGQLTDRIGFNSEFELEHGGPDGNAGDGEIKLEFAYLDYLINDAVNVRAGAVLMPFGRYNLYHDSPLNDLTDRPILARDIIPTGWSESGAGFFGEINPELGDYEDLVLSYEAYVVNGLDDGFSDTGIRGSRGSFKLDNNNNKALVGRLVASPVQGHELGLSGYTGSYNSDGDDINGMAIDLHSMIGPFELTTEYAKLDIDQPVGGADIADTMEGAYVQLGYDFWFDFLDDTFLGREFDDPKLAITTRWDWAEIDDDADAGVGNNEEERYTLGLAYRPTDNFVWKIEYQWNDTENEALERGNNDGFITSVALGF